MPHLNFGLLADGLVVDASVGLSAPQAAQWVQSGQPVPAAVRVRALIDTGSDRSAAAPHVFQQLGLAPLVYGLTHTAGGSFRVNLYRTGLTILNTGPSTGPGLLLTDLLVSELTVTLPFDALIGMDVLRECLLVLDGPGQQFILGF
jgi:hypothetical protein